MYTLISAIYALISSIYTLISSIYTLISAIDAVPYMHGHMTLHLTQDCRFIWVDSFIDEIGNCYKTLQ